MNAPPLSQHLELLQRVEDLSAATSSSQAVEVLRVWAVPGQPQQLTLRTTWKDPGAWGLLLADVARHVAKAYENESHRRAEVLKRIRQLLEAEFADPTDTPLEL
jgi:hypothetical protein